MLTKIAGLIPHVSPPLPAASRRPRGPWALPDLVGPYKLPRAVQDRLKAALQDYRNRDAAAALAAFLGRFWSTPARLVLAFPVDRRALTDHPALGLSEARVRGAIATLVAIGFLDVDPVRGSAYRATEAGLHRKPVLYRFGAGYREDFDKANVAARATRSKTPTSRRLVPISSIIPRPMPLRLELAQKESPRGRGLIMGEHEKLPEEASPLERALAQLRSAVFEGDSPA